MRSRKRLRSYQRYLSNQIVNRFIAALERRKRVGLLAAAEMGLGKTGATLDALVRLLNMFLIRRILIVAPLRVANETWPDEIGEWLHTRSMTFAVVTGTPEQRLEALGRDVEAHIINRENLTWLWGVVGGLVGWKWDVLVYDESSRLKGFTRRTEGGKRGPQLSEFGVLAAARTKFRLIIELSGTPAPNGCYDLGGQAAILDGGRRLGPNKTQFKKRFFNEDKYSYAIEPKPGAEEEIMALMADVMIGLRAEDYIDLPPTMVVDVPVSLPKKILTEYRKFEKTLVSEEYDVEAVSRGVLVNKLLQFANGHIYRPIEGTNPPKREAVKIHDVKLEALERIVEEAAGQSIMLAYSYKFDVAAIRKRFPWATVFDEEPNAVKLWNSGKIKLLLAHPASIGHGLNLQFGGHIQVWYGLTWSLELYQQFNKRLARSGQKNKTVFIYRILAKGTYDMLQAEALEENNVTQQRLTEKVRVRLRKLRVC